jgi:hypothetical protein
LATGENGVVNKWAAAGGNVTHDRLAGTPHLDYWMIASFASFVIWILHSYAVRFFFMSVRHLIIKFL